MTSAEILVDAFGRVLQTVHEVVRGMTSGQLAERLAPEANSIAWLVWHLTRVQDDHVADAFGVPQVWTEYGKRFELPLEPYDTWYRLIVAVMAGPPFSAGSATAMPPAVAARIVSTPSWIQPVMTLRSRSSASTLTFTLSRPPSTAAAIRSTRRGSRRSIGSSATISSAAASFSDAG